jgi:protein dithiol oxidoreductase (disulfide-forming)
MFKRIAALLVGSLAVFACQAQPVPFQEGTHYFKVEPAQPTATPGKVEVVEVFSYACIHCAHFEPIVANWKKTMPKEASFSYMPAIFNPSWEMFARAFYAAEVLGIIGKTHQPTFDAVFDQKRPMQTIDQIAEFMSGYGKSADEFKKAMNSFGVEMKINRAKKAVVGYQVDGTPSVVVAGKWRVTGQSAGSIDNVFKVVDYLVKLEAAKLPKAAAVKPATPAKPVAAKN